MNELVKMVVVLTILSAFSGGLLAAVRNGTMERIEYQQLINDKGPAIKKILENASNNPMEDKFKIKDGKNDISFFVGIIDGKANILVFEGMGKGYGGALGLMVGVNIDEDKIIGVGVTTHKETPGIGSRAKTESGFTAQFAGFSINEECKVKDEDGKVDALSGATITSKGVCSAVTAAGDIYKRLKPQIIDKLKAFSK